MVKVIMLEKDNYRIDSTGRKAIKDPNGVRVLENPEGDVWEYLEGECKGEQLFTFDAVKRLGLQSKLPTFKHLKELVGKDYEGFKKENNIKLCGWHNPSNGGFYGIDGGFNIWCYDGSYFDGRRNGWNHNDVDVSCGFSVRCVHQLDLAIGLFKKLAERSENNGASLGAKAGYELGKILE